MTVQIIILCRLNNYGGVTNTHCFLRTRMLCQNWNLLMRLKKIWILFDMDNYLHLYCVTRITILFSHNYTPLKNHRVVFLDNQKIKHTLIKVQ
jgi:hypothetical protein